MTELHSFISEFHQLWKAGVTAHLHLDTYAGQAWVGLRVQLGQPHQYPPQSPTHHSPSYYGQPHQYPPQSPTHCSLSYYRRQEHREAAKAVDATVTNTEETSAGKVGCVFTAEEMLTEKVDHHPQELEPEKCKDNYNVEAVEFLCEICDFRFTKKHCLKKHMLKKHSKIKTKLMEVMIKRVILNLPETN